MNLQDLFKWFLILFDLSRDYGDQTNVEWHHTILKGFQCQSLWKLSQIEVTQNDVLYFLIKKKKGLNQDRILGWGNRNVLCVFLYTLTQLQKLCVNVLRNRLKVLLLKDLLIEVEVKHTHASVKTSLKFLVNHKNKTEEETLEG